MACSPVGWITSWLLMQVAFGSIISHPLLFLSFLLSSHVSLLFLNFGFFILVDFHVKKTTTNLSNNMIAQPTKNRLSLPSSSWSASPSWFSATRLTPPAPSPRRSSVPPWAWSRPLARARSHWRICAPLRSSCAQSSWSRDTAMVRLLSHTHTNTHSLSWVLL